jgi:site-specific DNA-methyltransferase (adenine-specific)
VKPYYEHAGITIYHGDCREILPQLKAELLCTDPPYGVELGSNVENRKGANHRLVKQAYESYEDTLENLRAIVVPAIRIALGVVERGIVFCAGKNITEYPKPDAVGGIYFPAGSGRTSWGFNTCALALMYGKAPNLPLGARPIMVSSTEHAQKNGHPCPKPLGPMKKLIALGSTEQGIVLDPFMGSGTTLEAAKLLGRFAIGIEVEEKYCEIAAKRLAQEVFNFAP